MARGGLGVAVLCGATVAAQGPPALTLEEAIERGLANSLRVAELQRREEAAEAAEAGRAAARLPAVALLGGYTRTNHVPEFAIAQPGQPLRVLYPDLPDNYRARLDLQWPIYTAGRADALQRAARAERGAAAADLSAARADLRLEITRAFWALVTAREAEAALTRSIDRIDAHVRDLQARLEEGLVPPNELLSAEAQRSRERLLALEAANTRAIAEADLRRLLGLEDGPIEPRAQLEIAAPLPESPGGLLTLAREQRPERRALEARATAARARLDAAAAGGRPQVSLAAGVDYARPNPRIFPRIDQWHDSWDVSVNVSWSVWDGGRVRAERAEAAAVAGALVARVGEFDRQVAFEVRQRQLELDSSLAAIDVAQQGLQAAAEAHRVVAERFSAGVASNTDVLDAQTAVIQAELDLTRARATARLAQARLARAVGQ